MADFGRELLACAVEGAGPDGQNPLRHVADLPPRAGTPACLAPVGRSRCGAGVCRSRHRSAVVASAHRGRPRTRRPPRRAEHRNSVGQVLAYQLPILTALNR